jgi:methylenetetrahydrofolate reductase (NADPH)
MGGVPKEKMAEEGISICLETIRQIREIKGVHGIHLMAIEWEEKVPELVKAAGLFPRP